MDDQLPNGWRDEIDHVIDRVFGERFTEWAAALEAQSRKSVEIQVAAGLERAVAHSSARVRRELTERLNRAVRRLRAYQTEEQWINALLDSTEGFAQRCWFFSLDGQRLRCRGGRGLNGALPAEVALGSAPAFRNAIESLDTVVSIRTSGELSKAMVPVDDPGGSVNRKAFLFPLVHRNTAVAVLYAESDEDRVAVSALELLTNVAALALKIDTPKTVVATPSNNVKRQLHLRAQQFARVQVAAMILHKSAAVRAGRTAGDLYASLHKEIETGRDAFRRNFMSASPSAPLHMVDYFHSELVGTLAKDDNAMLGPEYPGPMV